jgi:hypothetical protein
VTNGRVRKRSAVVATPPDGVQPCDPPFRAEGQGNCSARRPSTGANVAGMADQTSPLLLHVAVVDCPYCDGENAISAKPSDRARLGSPDREIACRHCQCLFLLSESKEGIHTRLAPT